MSSSYNPFVKQPSEYTRDLDIIENYINTSAQYIQIETGDDIESIKTWLRESLQPVDPELHSLSRPDGADRKRIKHGLTPYLKEIVHGGKMVGPNLVAYENPEKKLSFLSEFVENGLTKRAAIKKKGQKAYMEGDFETATFCDNQQVRVKTLNNTLSGAHSSPHNPIYNASAHTTLTSVCRCATSYSNAVVEKLLAGNRHYYSPDVCLSDMVSVIRITDLERLKEAVIRYKIKPPTAKRLYMHVIENCQKYWRNEVEDSRIHDFIHKLSDIERIAVGYVGDLYFMRVNNDALIRTLFTKLITVPSEPVANPEEWCQRADADLVAMIGLIVADLLKGRTVAKLAEESKSDYGIYGAAIKNVIETIAEYGLLFESFLRTDNLPTGIHSIPTMLRKAAIVSDTDSTIFTTEEWVDWYTGTHRTDGEAMAVAATIAYIDTQVLAHTLAMLSRHLGVGDDKLHRLAMKSEFYFPAFGVINQTKHYFSYIKACEGNVFPKLKLDTKGVNLKNSRLPGEIRKGLNDYIRWVLDCLMTEKHPTLAEVLEQPAKMAHRVRNSLINGDTEFLSAAQIKQLSAYKNPNAPAFQQYTFWNTVFADVYGEADIPPYSAVKIPVTITNRMLMEKWAATLPLEAKQGLRKWFLREVKYVYSRNGTIPDATLGTITLSKGDTILLAGNYSPICGPSGTIYQYEGPDRAVELSTVDPKVISSMEYVAKTRDGFTNFLIPSSRLQDGKIPELFRSILDIDKIEDEMIAAFLLVLETTGYYMRNGNRTRLLSKEVDMSFYQDAKTKSE